MTLIHKKLIYLIYIIIFYPNTNLIPHKYLYPIKICKFNESLTNLPNQLTHLKLSNSYDKPLENLPPTLTHLILSCSYSHDLNNLPSNLDYLPNSLTHLIFSKNSIFIGSLDNLPNQLKYLQLPEPIDIEPNTIIILNNYKKNILQLEISRKNIIGLLDLGKFTKITKLDCSCNLITNLLNLPLTLKELDCSNNKITQLTLKSYDLIKIYWNLNPMNYVII